MALTDLQLCSKALILCGANTISSFDEGTVEAEIAGTLYASTRDALLSAHRWQFCTAQHRLNKRADRPVADYRFAYQLPNDFLAVISLGDAARPQGAGATYRIMEARIETDLDGAILTYTFRADERRYPPYFSQALISALAAAFALPITESNTRADRMTTRAERDFQQAKRIASQQQTPAAMPMDTLVAVRG